MPGRNSAAPHPSREEILCNKNNPDLPESFVEPTKKKAKRHLIHQQLEQSEEQQEQVAIKEDIISLDSEEPVAEEDLELLESDEQAFEVMKEIYYKAGEMESDGLEEWDKDKPDESKKKGKKPIKRPKLKSISSSNSSSCSSSDSQQLSHKHRRIKSEPVQRTISPHVGIVEIASPSSTGTVKPAPPRLANMFSGFRIPKKAPTPAVDADFAAWTEDEHNASRALTSLAANMHFTPTIKQEQPDQFESKKEFSKTRIQTPSPNSHIKSCPAVAQRCPSPLSPFQHGSTSSSGLVSASHPASEVKTSLEDIQVSKPLFQQSAVHMKNSKSPGSDERRSRKQKCPRINRSGLDARDLSAKL